MKEQHTRKDADQILLSALVQQIDSAPAVAHPAPEEIAMLVDGALAGESKDDLMKHLASCRDCREVFLMARSLAEEEVVRHHKPRSFFIPFAMAATVVVAVSAFVLVGKQGADKPVQVAQIQTPPVAPANPEKPVVPEEKAPPKPVEPSTTQKPDKPEEQGEQKKPKIRLPLRPVGEGRVMVASLELSDDIGKYLSQRSGEVVSDAKGIKALVMKLEGEEPRLVDVAIREVRVVQAPSRTKAFSFGPPKRAELQVKDGVLTIVLGE